jgi:hypothetical protein
MWWTVTSQSSYAEVLTPISQEVTALGDRVVREVTEINQGQWVGSNLAGVHLRGD